MGLRCLPLSALLVLAVSSAAQTKPTNWTPLPMETPKAMQTTMPAGPKPASDVLHISVTMPYADPDGIKAFVDSVSDPKSPNYRKFLTPEEVGQQFGISAASVNK